MPSAPRLTGAELLAWTAAESDRFTSLLAATDPDARVPSCPDWSASDLLWHLLGVQWFWGSLASGEHTDPAAARDHRPERPAEHEALVALQRRATDRLVSALAAGADDDPLWTWWPADQTRRFARRRQAHEVLIHRVDAELTADVAISPLDAALATDGVDEALTVIFAAGAPGAGRHAALGPVELRTTDTGARWHVLLDEGVHLGDGTVEPVAQVVGSAADLDRWLWHRAADDAVQQLGDPVVLAAFVAALRAG